MIPVMFVYRVSAEDEAVVKKHAILPALPVVGDLVIPPGETRARCVRAKEWDCSQSNGSTATIHIALD
jgi:hypothetical protein